MATLASAVLAVLALGAGASVGAQEDAGPEDVVSVEAAPELLDEVSAALFGPGWYLEEGVAAAPGATADLRASLLAAGRDWGLVALTTPPPRGTRNFAANLLAEVRSQGSRIDTVLVVTWEDVAGASRAWSDAEVDAALSRALPVLGADVVEGWSAVHTELTGEALVVSPADGGSGGVAVPLWVVVVGGLAAGAAAAGVAEAASRRRPSGCG